MGRKPCCDKIGLKRGAWKEEEDQKLVNFILNNGIQCWRLVPELAELKRCGKSCRLRWINYLRPDLRRGSFSEEEEDQIIQLHSRLGNRWAKIAAHFPGRTDNEIKNYWNGKIKKKLRLLGLDSQTHKKPIEHDQEQGSTDLNSIMFSSKEEVKFTPNGTNLGTSQRENNENDMCGSSGNDNVIGRLSDNLDEISSSSTTTSMIFQSDSSIIGNAFSEGMVEECHWFSENDFQHYGIYTTEHLLSWDGFNRFDDVSSVGDIYN